LATKKLDYSCLFFYHLFIIYSWFKLSLSMVVIWISIDICKIFLLWEIMYYFQCHLFLALLWETKYVSLIIIVGTVVTHGYFTSTCSSPVHLVKKKIVDRISCSVGSTCMQAPQVPAGLLATLPVILYHLWFHNRKTCFVRLLVMRKCKSEWNNPILKHKLKHRVKFAYFLTSE